MKWAWYCPWLWGSTTETLPLPPPPSLRTLNPALALRRAAATDPSPDLLLLSGPHSVLELLAAHWPPTIALRSWSCSAHGSTRRARECQPLPNPHLCLPPAKCLPSPAPRPNGERSRTHALSKQRPQLDSKTSPSPPVFPAGGDRAKAPPVTQTPGRRQERHGPQAQPPESEPCRCASGSGPRRPTESGPGQRLLPLAHGPGSRILRILPVSSTLQPPSLSTYSQNQALRTRPGDPAPRQNVSSARAGLSPVPQPRPQHPAERRRSTKTGYP